MNRAYLYILFPLFFPGSLITEGQAQSLRKIVTDHFRPFHVERVILDPDVTMHLKGEVPLLTLLIDSVPVNQVYRTVYHNDTMIHFFSSSIRLQVTSDTGFKNGLRLLLRFTNFDTLPHRLENLVPFGQRPEWVWISASGSKEWPGYLCRTKLHRPGYAPVGVVLPDNVWHMGYCDMPLNDSVRMVAMARRIDRDKERSSVDRWKVTLQPGGWVEYAMMADAYEGDWHRGLKMFFQERWLFDLPHFDDSLFRRTDLAWMKHTYLMLLQFAWDRKYYDFLSQRHTFYESLFEYDYLTGGFDIFTLWPTWPRLGLDPRNQWDMYRDLPGGILELRNQVRMVHQKGKRYFISYNPWDEGTRKEDHLTGMERLLRETGADGVVLDTRGASSKELQAAADRVKPGIIMYSEGMAIPRDMPGIVSGRVHDALVIPPPLNLNKFIKPGFAIFRVLQLADDRLHREIALAFFNGYGIEINTMKPGRPDWIGEEFRFMGRTTRILRENSQMFTNGSLFPLMPTLIDSVYVNEWHDEDSRLYTIFSLNPRGYTGPLFTLSGSDLSTDSLTESNDYRWIDLWNHMPVAPVWKKDSLLVPVNLEPFDPEWLDTRREGNPGCIARFRQHLQADLNDGLIRIRCNFGDRISITGGNPDYLKQPIHLPVKDTVISCLPLFGANTSRIVVQLFLKEKLIDEVILSPIPGTPMRVEPLPFVSALETTPEGMVEIPAGLFRFCTVRAPGTLIPFIPLPGAGDTKEISMPSYFMDRYPVTNIEFKEFLDSSGYIPEDTTNFLAHWADGKIVPGMEDHPVVFVSLHDAMAYARWAGKRLPTETEWQYAAQGTDMRKYPWGNEPDSLKCNNGLNKTTPVRQFPDGVSPFGVMDMIGNVWQMTGDLYDNGSYFFTMIRGGSHYAPEGSIWYVTGGMLPADHPELLLHVSPGLDRNSTVGFRCVADKVK